MLSDFVAVSRPEGMSANSPGLSEARQAEAQRRLGTSDTPGSNQTCLHSEGGAGDAHPPVVVPNERETPLRPAPGLPDPKK